jgi:hypothetical protein
MQSEEELRARARRRAEQKVGFHTHLAAYVLVNALLIIIWWFTGAGFPWFIFVLIFWGIGLLAHAVGVYAGGGYTERIAEREYQRLKERK